MCGREYSSLGHFKTHVAGHRSRNDDGHSINTVSNVDSTMSTDKSQVISSPSSSTATIPIHSSDSSSSKLSNDLTSCKAKTTVSSSTLSNGGNKGRRKPESITCHDCGEILPTRKALSRHREERHRNKKRNHSKTFDFYSSASTDDQSPGLNNISESNLLTANVPNTLESSPRPSTSSGISHHPIRREHVSPNPDPSLFDPHSNKRPRVTCHKCGQFFPGWKELHKHRKQEHAPSLQLQDCPFDSLREHELPEPWKGDASLREMYNRHRPIILAPHDEGIIIRHYNFPVLPGFNINLLAQQLREMYARQDHAFKINFSMSMILQHVETGEYRFFYASNNGDFFDSPRYIGDLNDLERVIQELRSSFDSLIYAMKQRKDTKWRLVFIY